MSFLVALYCRFVPFALAFCDVMGFVGLGVGLARHSFELVALSSGCFLVGYVARNIVALLDRMRTDRRRMAYARLFAGDDGR